MCPSAALDLGYFGAADTRCPDGVTLLVGHSLGFLWLVRQRALRHVPLVGINAFPRFLEAEDYRPAVAARVLERMRRRVVGDTRSVLEDFWTRAGAAGPDRDAECRQHLPRGSTILQLGTSAKIWRRAQVPRA